MEGCPVELDELPGNAGKVWLSHCTSEELPGLILVPFLYEGHQVALHLITKKRR
jgi:hypothetical protein